MELKKKLGIAGGSMFVFGIMFGWMIFPKVLRSQIKKQIALKPKTEMREMWSAFPLPLDFKVYLFNISNPDEIKNGATPIVNEVGPFFYDEYKEKVELEDREEDDTVEYKQRVKWIFNQAKTAPGLSEETEIVFPHIMILGIILATLKEKPTAIGIVSKGIDSIFKKPESIFIKVKVKDLLFGGLPVDCDVADFAGSAICGVLKEEAEDLVEERENFYRFSVFGSKNNTIQKETIRVYRGIKNYKDVGRVVEFKGMTKQDIWGEEGHCNEYNGTDSTIFPPLMTTDDDIVSFGPEICRSLSAWFVEPSYTKGLHTYRYTTDLGDMSTDPELKCFCPETGCLAKGLMDLQPCVGAPIIGTLPHFYLTDEKYLQQVQGLHPDPEKHALTMHFEPMTATPIEARKRLQFNMMIGPVEKFKLMKTFPSCLLPLFWVEEGISLDDQFVKKVKVVFIAQTGVAVLKWLMIIGGIGMGGASGYMYYKNSGSENKLDITKVSPQTGSGKDSSQEKKWPQMNISTIQAATVPPNLDRD